MKSEKTCFAENEGFAVEFAEDEIAENEGLVENEGFAENEDFVDNEGFAESEVFVDEFAEDDIDITDKKR